MKNNLFLNKDKEECQGRNVMLTSQVTLRARVKTSIAWLRVLTSRLFKRLAVTKLYARPLFSWFRVFSSVILCASAAKLLKIAAGIDNVHHLMKSYLSNTVSFYAR